ncbi:MAG: conserved membrane protein of unknown function [Candidatus Thorarchaeota archaeon]|nr:MAG: conserved membrane protein of unknown function [Candidatus Thorarchaeota archaeon]
MEIASLQTPFKKMFSRWDDSPNDQQFYVKIFFAFISSLLCALGGLPFAGIRGLMFGVFVYILSLYVIVYLLEIDPETLGGRQKLITNTLPSYLLLWVLLWTLFYAFLIPPGIITNLNP